MHQLNLEPGDPIDETLASSAGLVSGDPAEPQSMGRSASPIVNKVSRRVAVFGQGPRGLSLAMRAVGVGHDVVGFDLDRARIAALLSGRSPVAGVADSQLAAALATQRYRPTNFRRDLVGFDVAVIALDGVDSGHVVTDGPPLTMPVAARILGRHLRPGCVVISETPASSAAFGSELVTMLEAESGLRVGQDVHLGQVVERRERHQQADQDPGPGRQPAPSLAERAVDSDSGGDSGSDRGLSDAPEIPGVEGIDVASTQAVIGFYRSLSVPPGRFT